AWKRQNAREKGYTPSRATTPVGRRSGATQIGSKRRSRPNSKTASLHPECKQIFAVHAPSAYIHNSTPFSCQWVGPPGPWKLKTLNELWPDFNNYRRTH